MKKVKTQIIFEITDVEKKSEDLLNIKNSILSGEFKRELCKNNIKTFKVERDYIPEKIKSTFICNKLNSGFNQVIWNLSFNITDIAEKATKFVEFVEMFSNGELIEELTKKPNLFNIEKNFTPKNLIATINIK